MSEHDDTPNARWTRDRLDAYAVEQGVDPARFAKKEDLVAALVPAEDAAAPDDEGDGDGTDAPAEDDGEPDPAADDKGDDAQTAAARYTVLKAITLADGRTVMPGEEFTPDETFPSRRCKQLVEQKFLRPIG